MRKARFVVAVLLVVPLALAAAGATGSPSRVVGQGVLGADGGSQAVLYTHNDCVGPGLPLTASPHVTHTTNVPGFAFNGRAVFFSLTPLAILGAGICPTTVGGPVLPQDFTGRYHLTAVCRGTSNDGAVTLDWILDIVAGLVQGQGSAGTPCFGLAGASFSLDITIEMSTTTFLSIPLDPLGGIRLSVSQ